MKRLTKTADNIKEQIYESIHNYVWENVTEEDIEKAIELIKNFTKALQEINSTANKAFKNFEENNSIIEKVFKPISNIDDERHTQSFDALNNLSNEAFLGTKIFDDWTIEELAQEDYLLHWFNVDINKYFINREKKYKEEVDEVYDSLTDEEKQLAITDFETFHDECI